MPYQRSLFIFLVPLLLCGCSYSYRGDGTFVDHGIKNPSVRYSLTLTGIDLCKKETYAFDIGRLPSSYWSGNFIYPREGDGRPELEKVRSRVTAARIEMRVFDKETGKVVFEYAGRLKNVSDGFPGSPYDAVIGNGYIDLHIVGDVFGLYDPKNIFGVPIGTYGSRELVISIVEPLSDLKPYCEAKLRISNGGWE